MAFKLVLIGIISIFVSIDLAAQNNPFKIDDKLYDYYRRASNMKRYKKCLAIADTMYNMSVLSGDKKAVCLALSLYVNHYNITREDTEFYKAVERLAREAERSGQMKYYYFARSSKITYEINKNHFLIALQETESLRKQAVLDNNYYGQMIAIRALGNIYMVTRNYEMAEKYLKESLDIMINHLPDQDHSAAYMRLSTCHLLQYKLKEAIKAGETGLALVKNPNNYFSILNILLKAYFEAKEYDKYNKVYDHYKQYIETQGSSVEKKHLQVLKELTKGNTDEAARIAYGDSKTPGVATVTKLMVARGEYREALNAVRKFNRTRDSADINESPALQISEIDASLEKGKLNLNRLRLEYEMTQQLLQQSAAEAELEAQKKANITMQLSNDSLLIARMKADSLRTVNEHATHDMELSIMKSEAHTRHIISLVAWLAFIIVLSYATVAYIRSRLHLRKLNTKNQELTEALDQAQELERMKSAFTKNLSHDIRTPLNAVVGFSELMLNGEGLSEEDKAEIKDKIEESSNVLTTIVNDVLQLSFIESGRQKVEKKECGLNEIINNSISDITDGERNGKAIDCEGNADIMLTTDKKLLETALIHGLKFALNHTCAKGINLRTGVSGNDADISIEYDIDPKTECDNRALTGNATLSGDMEAYKMSLSVSRAAVRKLTGAISFQKTRCDKARILLNIPLKTIIAVVITTAALLCPMSAKAQFTKQKLEPEIYKIYTEAQNNRDLPLGLKKAREVYKIGLERGDKYIQCVGLGVELQHHVMNSNDKEAFSAIRQIQRLATDIHDTLYYYMAFGNEVAIHLNNHHTLRALKCCLELRDKVDNSDDYFGQYTCYRMLGNIYRVRKNHEQACQWYIKALKLFKQYSIKHDPTMSILRVATLKRIMYDYEGARKYIDEARNIPNIERYKYLINLEEAYLAFEKNDTSTFRKFHTLAMRQKEKHGFRYPEKEGLLEAMNLVFNNRMEEANTLAKEKLTESEYRHLATVILTNMGDWKEAMTSYNAERELFLAERANVFEADKAEMKELIGNNELEANNMRLRLEAARLEIEHNKAVAELNKYEETQRQLLATNNQLAISKMKANKQLESTFGKRNAMIRKQHTADARQATVTIALAVFFTLLVVVVSMLYKRASRINAKRLRAKNAELEEARKRAEVSDKMKSIFIQNMSHEIRTPLNAIVGFSQLLLNPDMEFGKKEREDFGRIIRTNSELLTTLVGDIISISELESGRYSTHLQKESVNTICKNSLQTVIHRTKQNVAMVFDKQLDDDFSITTDAQRVCQVLINFLTNAIKYTEKGSITISAKADEDTKTVTFSVTDTGIGIPLDKQKDIFERFMKLDDFHQGTGLGLNICHLIAEKLGGEVGIDPTYTAGSRFLLKLKN